METYGKQCRVLCTLELEVFDDTMVLGSTQVVPIDATSQKLGVSSKALTSTTIITSSLLVQDIDDDQAVTTKGERVMSQRIVSCEKTGELAKKAPTPQTSPSSN